MESKTKYVVLVMVTLVVISFGAYNQFVMHDGQDSDSDQESIPGPSPVPNPDPEPDTPVTKPDLKERVTVSSVVLDRCDDIKVQSGSVMSLPEVRDVPEGMAFDRWYTDSGFEHPFDPSLPITSDMVLYAHFLPVSTETLIVTFIPGDLSGITLRTADANSQVTAPEVPDLNGKRCVWFHAGRQFDFSTPIRDNIILEGRFIKVDQCCVTFNTMGGSMPSGFDEYINVDAGNPIGNVPVPVRVNSSLAFVFTGWYKEQYTADRTEPWDLRNDLVTEDMVLFAGWEHFSKDLIGSSEIRSMNTGDRLYDSVDLSKISGISVDNRNILAFHVATVDDLIFDVLATTGGDGFEHVISVSNIKEREQTINESVSKALEKTTGFDISTGGSTTVTNGFELSASFTPHFGVLGKFVPFDVEFGGSYNRSVAREINNSYTSSSSYTTGTTFAKDVGTALSVSQCNENSVTFDTIPGYYYGLVLSSKAHVIEVIEVVWDDEQGRFMPAGIKFLMDYEEPVQKMVISKTPIRVSVPDTSSFARLSDSDIFSQIDKAAPDLDKNVKAPAKVYSVVFEHGLSPTVLEVVSGSLVTPPEIEVPWGKIMNGWAVKGTKQIVDFSTLEITGDVTFVPVFTDDMFRDFHKIYTEQDLLDISKDMNGSYVLMKDIKLTKDWEPLGARGGNNVTNFTGVFNGNGHKIIDMKYDSKPPIYKTGTDDHQGNVGFFARLDEGALVCDVEFYNASVKAQTHAVKDKTLHDYRINVGIIAGACAKDVVIRDCTVSGYVGFNPQMAVETANVGSIVGAAYINSSIIDCTTSATVNVCTKDAYGGGITGSLYDSATILRCTVTSSGGVFVYSMDDFSHYCFAGGIVGYANTDNSVIKDCYNYGKVSGDIRHNAFAHWWVGGIVGGLEGKCSPNIDNCHSVDDILNRGKKTPIGIGTKSDSGMCDL